MLTFTSPEDASTLRRGRLLHTPYRQRVFVVDDERLIAQTTAAILECNGFSAKFFSNPLDALAAAETDAPDLLISDVIMPQLSGVELAIRISTLYPDCRIMLISGQAQTVDLLETARNQGRTFQLLAKPIHPLTLLSKIRDEDFIPSVR